MQMVYDKFDIERYSNLVRKQTNYYGVNIINVLDTVSFIRDASSKNDNRQMKNFAVVVTDGYVAYTNNFEKLRIVINMEI